MSVGLAPAGYPGRWYDAGKPGEGTVSGVLELEVRGRAEAGVEGDIEGVTLGWLTVEGLTAGGEAPCGPRGGVRARARAPGWLAAGPRSLPSDARRGTEGLLCVPATSRRKVVGNSQTQFSKTGATWAQGYTRTPPLGKRRQVPVRHTPATYLPPGHPARMRRGRAESGAPHRGRCSESGIPTPPAPAWTPRRALSAFPPTLSLRWSGVLSQRTACARLPHPHQAPNPGR